MNSQLAFLSQNEKGGLIFGNTEGKTVNAFSFEKGLPLVMGTQYNVELEEKISKAGKPYQLVKSIKDLSGKELMPPKKQWTGGGRKYDPVGESKGNYRTCLTTYLVACIANKTSPDVVKFNNYLRQGDKDMFPVVAETATPVTQSVVVTAPKTEDITETF